ncbi:MAG TPA: flagellar hook-associated protein FlgK, partial [Micromonosporaceae bacterium]|nr:flagellar hook-associated protein FlgK [Micromonosporaceae bacterium]
RGRGDLMSGSFGGLSTALSSLYAQRRALDTTGQNIANANTEGYSRQRVGMQAASATPVPALYSTSDGVGGGVAVSDVARLRDTFLEARGRAEHGNAQYLAGRQEIFGRIENIFAEPSDTALASQLDDFWNGWSEVSSQATNTAVRSQLLERGRVVADGLRAAYDNLDAQWSTLRSQVDAYTTDVNTAAEAVALLNRTIKQQKAAGLPANELADQRDLHLMELSKLTGATTVARDDGTVDVYVGGSALVSDGVARQLVAAGGRQLATVGEDKVQFRWGGEEGPPAAMTGGRLAAALDTLNEIIPTYSTGLDDVAARLAQRVNEVHSAGYPMDGTDTAGDFFTSSSAGLPVTARTISVAITDARDLGVSGVPGSSDGANADALAQLAKGADGPDAAYRKLVVGLGVESQAAQRRSDIQARVAADIDVLRTADAGVNLDEEMTNMITFQRAYEAASRVLTSVDQMLDVLINRTGLVGRG